MNPSNSIPTIPTIPTILIIDDTPTNLEVLYSALSQAGYEILVEMDGQSGLEQARRSAPDVILLDVMMPGIDGFETCRQLKSNAITADIPVIFMTALAEANHKVTGFSVGAVDYITKPFQQEEVLARVKTHLNMRRMTQMLENQNHLLQDFNRDLETIVTQRTTALNKANMQLIQQEKLSALGQMVAGVAHEINNPVGFIYGNCLPAKEYADQLLDLVQVYQSEYPQPTALVQEKIKSIDLIFLAQDLPKVISSMQIGADRIRQIVLSLRSFSRLDEAEQKEVDIDDGINNTLLILGHRLKGEHPIKIIKDDVTLPLINCFPGQMNQVFTNILSNAIDAVHDRVAAQVTAGIVPTPGEIIIRRRIVSHTEMVVEIIDNGAGMPPEVQNKLFEPFFTTKPVGKGTGLGLSISYQIVVENHRGELSCRSVLGQGTQFTITIPIDIDQARQAF
jgi:two-component system, NtrC family, sensor kinase